MKISKFNSLSAFLLFLRELKSDFSLISNLTHQTLEREILARARFSTDTCSPSCNRFQTNQQTKLIPFGRKSSMLKAFFIFTKSSEVELTPHTLAERTNSFLLEEARQLIFRAILSIVFVCLLQFLNVCLFHFSVSLRKQNRKSVTTCTHDKADDTGGKNERLAVWREP